MKRLAVIILAAILMVACDPAEQQARDAIAAASGAVHSAQISFHDTCTTMPSQGECIAINRAVNAVNFAVDALKVYCASPDYNSGGVCTPSQSSSTDRLKAAIDDMQRIVEDMKGIVKP